MYGGFMSRLTELISHIKNKDPQIGVELDITDWETVGLEIPLLVNMQPTGKYLGEAYHQAGGVPAVMHALLQEGKLHGDALMANGKTVEENYTKQLAALYSETLLPLNAVQASRAVYFWVLGERKLPTVNELRELSNRFEPVLTS